MELPEELRQLRELASKETDTEKLFALVAEIDRLTACFKNTRRKTSISRRESLSRVLSLNSRRD